MKRAFIILPNQLFKKPPSRTFEMIVLVEDKRFFTDFSFHKKKLVFHRATLKYYQNFLEKKNYNVFYLNLGVLSNKTRLGDWLKKQRLTHVCLYDPVDHDLQNLLKKEFTAAEITFNFLESPLFLCADKFLRNYFEEKNHYSMNSFYIFQRKHFKILLDQGKPKGGKWSYDAQNRMRLTKNVKVPKINTPKTSKYVKEAIIYIEKNFAANPGTADDFFYPITHDQAKSWLDDFIRNRLDLFGPYEDAISADERFLFHSLLSPLLNSGLITVEEVLAQVMDYSEQNTVRLNSLEGFIRQLIGWREFMRAIYIVEGQKQKKTNFWDFKQKIPQQFYDGTTGVEPVDLTIKYVLKNAYAHHIERLMVLGNFMLLCEIHPKEVYRWFMELFIDAYEWVMVPNVFGMSQYSDGGLMTTKPYISSSNYIRKMSNFNAGPWCDIWDSLFWRFIHKHKKVFAQNPRMKIMVSQVNKMGKEKIKTYVDVAEMYLNKIRVS
jgi:deoxyribodipyrimidine photolyase-related protein